MAAASILSLNTASGQEASFNLLNRSVLLPLPLYERDFGLGRWGCQGRPGRGGGGGGGGAGKAAGRRAPIGEQGVGRRGSAQSEIRAF